MVDLLQEGIRLAAQLFQRIIDRAPRQLDPLARDDRIAGREGIAQQRQPRLFGLADIACDNQLLNPPIGLLIIADHPNGRLYGFEVYALHTVSVRRPFQHLEHQREPGGIAVEFHLAALHLRIVFDGVHLLDDAVVPVVEILLRVVGHIQHSTRRIREAHDPVQHLPPLSDHIRPGNGAVVTLPARNPPVFRIDEQKAVEQSVCHVFGPEDLRQQIGLHRTDDVDARIPDKDGPGFRLADHLQRLAAVGRQQVFDEVVPVVVPFHGVEQRPNLIDHQRNAARVVLVGAHHRLGREVRDDGRYQLRLPKQRTLLRLTAASGSGRGKRLFIGVPLLVVLLVHPVVVLTDRFVKETQRRCLAEPRPADQHHVDGGAGLPFSLYSDTAGVPDGRGHRRQQDRGRIFYIEVLVTDQIQNQFLNPRRKDLQRQARFGNTLHLRAEHIGQLQPVIHGNLLPDRTA